MGSYQAIIVQIWRDMFMSNTSIRENLVTVAKLYYVGDLSQDEIAKIMGVSRPKVCRMLKICREKGIVQFNINTTTSHYATLAKKIKNHFSLKEVIVVPSDMSPELSKRNVGKRAAQFLAEHLEENMLIGMAWGSTLRHMVQEYHFDRAIPGGRVIQLTGGLHTQSIDMDGREMAKALAIKLGANWLLMQVPLVVQSKLLRDLLMQEPELTSHFGLFDKMNLAVVGLGSCLPNESITYKAGYISLEESAQLVQSGAVADICGHRISLDGLPANTFLSDRILSVNLESPKKTPLVVGIGSGEEKAFSIIAAARGGYVNTFIIDELAAMSVIGIARIQ
jgi:deoxyribonucleoside regulator